MTFNTPNGLENWRRSMRDRVELVDIAKQCSRCDDTVLVAMHATSGRYIEKVLCGRCAPTWIGRKVRTRASAMTRGDGTAIVGPCLGCGEKSKQLFARNEESSAVYCTACVEEVR
jgi:ribosomal protein S27AE